MGSEPRRWTTPKGQEPGRVVIANGRGLEAAILPNGGFQALVHRDAKGEIVVNQVFGSPLDGGLFRLFLRRNDGGILQALGPRGRLRVGTGAATAIWEGETDGLRHRVTLSLHPETSAWRWRVEASNGTGADLELDALLVQDLGLGSRGFLTNNEAYASQYMDHLPAAHAGVGTVLMSRQALAQDGGRHPWVLHACLDGSDGFATDLVQVFGPGYRDRAEIALGFGQGLPSRRLQHEAACAALQSNAVRLAPGATASWHFVGLLEPDHPAASGDAELARLDALAWPEPESPVPVPVPRSVVQDALPFVAQALDQAALDRHWPERQLEERGEGVLLSWFVADGALNRHVVSAAKEHLVPRRHGAITRSGSAVLPDERTLSVTHWMHGVFAAQLTIGNTSFHKLFSVSRDPYGITRASGLRILVDEGRGWRLLTVPSTFEIGLETCRWFYQGEARSIIVEATASGTDPAMRWRVTATGEPCRFLVFGHLVLGERELDHEGIVETDPEAGIASFRPDPGWLWGQRYPDAAYHLAVSSEIEALGGDELLYEDGVARSGAYIAFRTRPTTGFGFAVAGSLHDAAASLRLARAALAEIAPAPGFWTGLIGRLHLGEPRWDLLLPWLAHDAIVHLTVPHGLEQYTGGAWGTRDVCQGPVECLLALGHPKPVRAILETVFAQQYAIRGDWPQWFMLEPYSPVQDPHSLGDIIVWPLKALCDYVEATDDLDFLDQPVPWRDFGTLERTPETATVAAHIGKLIETVEARFIPGTSLIRLGEGDWNDSLQPADPAMRERMVSAWTVALLYQQIRRWAAIARRRFGGAPALDALADAISADFHRHLMRDGTVAGYAVFEGDPSPRLLLHPSDETTGLRYSLLPMTQGMLSGLFDDAQTRHHLALIRAHLLCPDGARLIDHPPAYRGGTETLFRRAESAANVGREIGLMYVHSHLRYAEAMALIGETGAFRAAILAASPIASTETVASAALRQRNAYFSSSDAAFPDRYEAAASWHRVRDGSIAVEGGWRIYSSGPGLFTSLLARHLAQGVSR